MTESTDPSTGDGSTSARPFGRLTSSLLARSQHCLPVALVIALTAYSLGRSGVHLHDLASFAAYVVLGLALPGVVLWRLLVSGGRRSLLEDLACGTSLAWAVELGVYLLCAHANHPGAAWCWPVVPLLVSIAPALRGRVWRRAGTPLPAWTPWFFSALIGYVVATLSQISWDQYPLNAVALRSPYVDIPYHLSLIGALSRHVPVDVPAVDGQPLYYHWFVHADLAAARHATGIEPLVLLTRLGPLAFAIVAVLGVAAITIRVTRSPLAGAIAAGLMTCAGGADLSGNFGDIFLSRSIFLSPTTVFAMAVLIAAIAISFELLRPDPDEPLTGRAVAARWAVLVLVLGAVSGAKGSLLPVLLGGYASVVVLGLVVERRFSRTPVALLVVAGIWFEVAQKLVYGGSAQGTGISPLGIGDRVVENYGLATPGHVSLALAVAGTAVYVISRLTFWAGSAGLFTRQTWRDPRAQFVVASGLAAVGALVVFNNAAYNQVYFLLVAPPLFAISSAWGFDALTRLMPPALVRQAALTGVAAGIAVGYLCKALFGHHSLAAYTRANLILPALGAPVACLLIAVVTALLLGGHHRRLVAALTAASAIASLGLPLTITSATRILTTPQNQFRVADHFDPPTIGLGGIDAARWVRAHSGPDAVVATNEHCRIPDRRRCDHRTTWIAAYSERQVLVEGWSYTSRSGDDAARLNVRASLVPFWDPKKLSDNDLAFTDPTPARIATLRDTYHVEWMIVDLRFPANLAGLRKVARERYQNQQYAVFEI